MRGYDLPGLNFDPETAPAPSRDRVGFFEPDGWQVCNDEINSQLKGRHPMSAVAQLQFLADHIRVMLYRSIYTSSSSLLLFKTADHTLTY